MAFWLLVKLETSGGTGLNHACDLLRADFEQTFGPLARRIPWQTIRRQYHDAVKLLKSPAFAAKAQAILAEVRRRQKETGARTLVDRLALLDLGITPDDLLRMLPPEQELSIRKARLAHLQNRLDATNKEIERLQAEKRELLAKTIK